MRFSSWGEIVQVLFVNWWGGGWGGDLIGI